MSQVLEIKPVGLPLWVKGGPSPNPAGRPKSKWQSYADRSAYYAEKFQSQELIDIFNDKKKFGKFSSFDRLIIKNLVNALNDDEGKEQFAAGERESFLNRYAPVPDKKDSTAADIAAAVVGAATTSIMNALSDKLLGAIAPEPVTLEQSATTSMEKK